MLNTLSTIQMFYSLLLLRLILSVEAFFLLLLFSQTTSFVNSAGTKTNTITLKEALLPPQMKEKKKRHVNKFQIVHPIRVIPLR